MDQNMDLSKESKQIVVLDEPQTSDNNATVQKLHEMLSGEKNNSEKLKGYITELETFIKLSKGEDYLQDSPSLIHSQNTYIEALQEEIAQYQLRLSTLEDQVLCNDQNYEK